MRLKSIIELIYLARCLFTRRSARSDIKVYEENWIKQGLLNKPWSASMSYFEFYARLQLQEVIRFGLV